MIVQAPDGKNIDFGNLPIDQVNAAMSKMYAAKPNPEAEMVANNKAEMGQGMSGVAKQLGAYGLNALQAIPFSDEAISGLGAAFGGGQSADFGSRYENLQQRQKAFRQAGRELNPGATAMGSIGAGLALTPLMPGGGPTKTLLGAVGKGAATGAAYGGLYGAGEGNAFADSKDSAVQRIINAGLGGIAGGVIGGTVPLVGAGLKKTGELTGLLAKPPEKLSADELRTASSELYKKSTQQGGILKPDFTDKFIDDISAVSPQTSFGKAIAGENEVTKLVERLKTQKNTPLTLEAAQEADSELGNLINKNVDAKTGKLTGEGRQLYDIQTKFRDMLDKATPFDMQNEVAANKEGFDTWKQAKELWAQQARLRDIEKIIERAENMDNPATVLKTGFRTLYNNKNRLRGFSQEERAAILEASKSGAATNLLRLFGSRLMPIGSAVGGGIAGGLPGAAVAGLSTEAASGAMRNLATMMQMNKANYVKDLITGTAQAVPTGFPVTNAANQGLAEFMRQQ